LLEGRGKRHNLALNLPTKRESEMKRFSMVTAIVLVGLLLFTSVAFALVSGPPSMDVTADSAGNSNNGNQIILGSSYSSATQQCTINSTGYFQWDLTNMAAPAGYADLALTYLFGANGTPIKLYAVDNDNWTESNAGAVKPALGTELQTITLASGTQANSTQTFATSQAFVDFVNSQASVVTPGADNKASFAVQIPSNCTSTAIIAFGALPGGTPAQLHLRTAAPPNVVEVSSASAQVAPSWPLYAGLAAVALFVVGGVVISRRRTA
jgi:hypothetical protein